MSEHRLKVMHVVFSLETGGLENGVVNLCNHLNPSEYQPSICAFQSGGELESRIDSERIELIEVKRLRNNDPSLPIRLAWHLWRRRIDVLHTHSWGTLVEGVVAAKLARTPIIVHGEHGLLETRSRNVSLQRLLWSKTHQVTAVASLLADQMSELVEFPRDRILVVQNGVDTDHFSPLPESRIKARRQLGLPPSDLLVGMVARLVPVKNHLGALRALKNLVATGKSITLALAGDGPLLGQLRRTTHELGLERRVHFLGDIPNVDQFLNSLDMFVLNSHSEGMSNTVLEAMACGIPVIATSVGSNSSIVVDHETGLLIPPDDPSALSEAIDTLAGSESKRIRMGEKSRARIESKYGIAKMVREYSHLYCQLREKHLPTAHTLNFKPRCELSKELGLDHLRQN